MEKTKKKLNWSIALLMQLWGTDILEKEKLNRERNSTNHLQAKSHRHQEGLWL
jgi:hypothetical protein